MTQKKQRQCIVKDKGYNSYYYGGATYGSDICKAKIYNENEIPQYIKNNPQEQEIIFLDTREGLELLVENVERLQNYIRVEKPRLAQAESKLSMLKDFGSVSRYLELYNKWHNPLTSVNEDIKTRIIEEIFREKA